MNIIGGGGGQLTGSVNKIIGGGIEGNVILTLRSHRNFTNFWFNIKLCRS